MASPANSFVDVKDEDDRAASSPAINQLMESHDAQMSDLKQSYNAFVNELKYNHSSQVDELNKSLSEAKQAAAHQTEANSGNQLSAANALEIEHLHAANKNLIRRAEAAEVAVESKEGDLASVAAELDNARRQIKESASAIARLQKSDNELRVALSESQDAHEALDRRFTDFGRERYSQGMQDAYDEDQKFHAQYDDMILENERCRTATKQASEEKERSDALTEDAQREKAAIEEQLRLARDEATELKTIHQECISADDLGMALEELRHQITACKDHEIEEAVEAARLEAAQEAGEELSMKTLDHELYDASSSDEDDNSDDLEGAWVKTADSGVQTELLQPVLISSADASTQSHRLQTDTSVQTEREQRDASLQTDWPHEDTLVQTHDKQGEKLGIRRAKNAATQTANVQEEAAVQTMKDTSDRGVQTDPERHDSLRPPPLTASSIPRHADSQGFLIWLSMLALLCALFAVLVEVRPGGSVLGVGRGAYGFDGAHPGAFGYALRALGAFLNRRQADHVTVLLHRREWLT